jgi:hypothetical protein
VGRVGSGLCLKGASRVAQRVFLHPLQERGLLHTMHLGIWIYMERDGHNTFEHGCSSGAGLGSWEPRLDIQHEWSNYGWDSGHNRNGSNSEGLNV